MQTITEIPLPFAVFAVERGKFKAEPEVIARLSTDNDAIFLAKNIFKARKDSVESVRVWDTDTMKEIANFL